MRCEICSHESTIGDFLTLRNLCEHLHLDSLAKKRNPAWTTTHIPIMSGRAWQRLPRHAIESPVA